MPAKPLAKPESMSYLLFFGAYTILSVSGLAILKHYLPQVSLSTRLPMRLAAWLILGASLYAASFATWLLILRSFPLATAYPISVGLTICGTTIVALLVLGETLRPIQFFGIASILMGIILVTRKA
jgi:multidrug transporter EmrE-like cation transporter